jgi:hypothetical protein
MLISLSSCAASEMILSSLKSVSGCLRMSSVLVSTKSSGPPRSRIVSRSAASLSGSAERIAASNAGTNLSLSIATAFLATLSGGADHLAAFRAKNARAAGGTTRASCANKEALLSHGGCVKYEEPSRSVSQQLACHSQSSA